jgi:uncharacterized membrane protein (UPF0127 family)
VKHVRVINATRGRELGSRVALANRWWPRLRGLIGRPRLEEGEGMLIEPCHGVHMFGMTYALDVALLDRDGEIVALYRDLAPGVRTKWYAAAHSALELPAGSLAATGTAIGDRVERMSATRTSEQETDR